MRMKKGLLVVVALLAMASLMAAMAFNSGYMHNSQKLTITTTDKALIALIPGDVSMIGNKDATASLDFDGALRFDFGKGLDGKMYGVQPGSEYVWDKLFSIKNNSNENIEYQFSIDEKLADYIKIYDQSGNLIYKPGNGVGPWVKLNNNTTTTFKAILTVNRGNALINNNGNAIVIGTRAVQ